MTTTNLTDEEILELEQLALEEAKLAEQADAIKERRETIKAALRDALGQGTHDLGVVKVQVKTPSRLTDWTKVAQAYPFTEHPDLWGAALDQKKAKAAIAPRDLETFAKTPGPAPVVVL